MEITISYKQEFEETIQKLKNKYPDKLFELEGIGTQLDIKEFSKKILNNNKNLDNSIDSNSNVSEFIPPTYINEISKPLLKLNSMYLLWKKMRTMFGKEKADEMLEYQINGTIYINDFHGITSGQSYCYNFSLIDIVNKGLPFINKIKTVPPKHLYSFKSQVEQFVAYASNNILGATGIADLLVVMSWYVEKILETKADAGFSFNSKESVWNYVKENIISLIYTLNQPFRSGIQSAFTNISLYDSEFIEDQRINIKFPDNRELNVDVLKKLQELFMDIMNDELKRTPITFPVVTACFAVDDNNSIIDNEFLNMISDKNREYGFVNIYCGKSSTLSSCCRLRSESDNPYFNSFGTGKGKIGSMGVCTINMPRITFESKDDKEILSRIKYLVNLTAKINKAKREIISKRIDGGFLPLYSLDFMNLNTQFSTTGLIGIYEFLNNIDKDITTDDGQNYLMKVLEEVNTIIDKNQEKYKAPHNVEMIPGENVAVKLAYKDKIQNLNNKYEMYSNQFIPLIQQADILDRVIIQGKFDKQFTGGSIAHLNIEQKVEDSDKLKKLIEFAANNGVIYFAINYNLQKCDNDHLTVGKNDKCSICNEPITENFTRVVGFLTAVKTWNGVRRDYEYEKRFFGVM